jgi:hypothetical protein
MELCQEITTKGDATGDFRIAAVRNADGLFLNPENRVDAG